MIQIRERYNTFHISKINNGTIDIALRLKKELEKTTLLKEASLVNPEPAHIPTDEAKFLEYLCLKHLHLTVEDGLPLLKQAFKEQYKTEDEYRLCKYCNKPFKFTRANSIFCSNRCRQRFYRNKQQGRVK